VKILALTGTRTPIPWSEPGAGRTSRAEKEVGKKSKGKDRGTEKEPECFLLVGLRETEKMLCNKKVFPCYDLNLVPQVESEVESCVPHCPLPPPRNLGKDSKSTYVS
jgi:hypothetical protein